MEKVPIILIEVDDKKALEIALVENLQREDLNPIEEAKGYSLLKETFNLTQEQVSERVGKGRTTITNALRLLELSDFSIRYEKIKRWNTDFQITIEN